MGTLLQMSEKERARLKAVALVLDGSLSVVEAARRLGISERQMRRSVGRYRCEQDAGLLHRGRGRSSGRATHPAIKAWALELYQARYGDYPPTHASQAMAVDAEAAVSVHPETLRLWLVEAKLWEQRKPKQKHRTWRKRKARFGELVQLDGSFHHWFEDRGPVRCQMTMVDDATGITLSLFAEQETTRAAMDLLEAWILMYGIPEALYVDRKTVYLTDREKISSEQLSGTPPRTQFGRACHKLGIRIIAAHSPQAKGRVERKHGVMQERQIRDMRQAGICDIGSANAFLSGGWLHGFNEMFARPAADLRDAHCPVPRGLNLHTVFCEEDERTVGADWTVRWLNRRFQIVKQPNLPPARAQIRVQLWRDGSVHCFDKSRELKAKEIDPAPSSARAVRPELTGPVAGTARPTEDHSWRTGRFLPIDTISQIQQREALASDYMCDTVVAGITVGAASPSPFPPAHMCKADAPCPGS